MSHLFMTGASGFVGGHLVRAAIARGDTVTGLAPHAAPPGAAFVAWFPIDLQDSDLVAEAVAAARPDAVVHLAAQSSAARSFEDPRETFAANVQGTWNLLAAVRRSARRARVLVVGSGEVYGPQPTGSRADEETPFAPVSPYAFSKAIADLLARAMHDRHGLDVIRTRSFGHAGPGQTARFFLPSLAQQIAAVESGEGEPVVRVGNLDVTRDLTDVRDVVAAYLGLLQRGRAGAAYNVCRGEGYRLSDLARAMVSRARRAIRVEVDPARLRPVDVPWLVGSRARIEREIGWRPTIEIERLLDDLLADARRSGPAPGAH